MLVLQLICWISLLLNKIPEILLRGGLVENLVITEFRKSRFNKGYEPEFYFYRDSNNHEIDLIFKFGNDLVPIEIKASRTFNPIFLDGIKYFQKIASDRSPSGILVYSGDQEQLINRIQICNYKNIEKALDKVTNQL